MHNHFESIKLVEHPGDLSIVHKLHPIICPYKRRRIGQGPDNLIFRRCDNRTVHLRRRAISNLNGLLAVCVVVGVVVTILEVDVGVADIDFECGVFWKGRVEDLDDLPAAGWGSGGSVAFVL
jgi:hypothetical protein